LVHRWHFALELLDSSSAKRRFPYTEHCSRSRCLADSSGWKGVYDILVKDGYKVSMVQEPETSFKEDVAATERMIAQQDGPCVVVAHSYGGSVITEAANDPKVVALVYVAAHMPDSGESEAENGKRFPSDLDGGRFHLPRSCPVP
jgi:pimeloyl-ACP methyl ester carboxylesterase